MNTLPYSALLQEKFFLCAEKSREMPMKKSEKTHEFPKKQAKVIE